MFKLSPQKPHLEVQDYIKHQDVYMWCLAWDIALKGHIPFASCYFAEIVLLNWAFLPDLKDASKSTCSIMMHQRTAVHFSLTQRRNNTQSRGDLWVSSLMYSKVATKLKSREVANYVSSVTTMNQLKKCWVSYLRRFSPIVRHHICCLDLVYWLQRKASLKHVHKHILMNFRNNLHTFPLAEFCRYISTSKGWICPEVNI